VKLTKLRLAQIRQFRGTLEIPFFEPGLNIFWGANEAGKSTVVRAIRAAFLERYKSGVIDDLLPRGETASTCSPTVQMQFSSGDKAHVLSKTFFHKKRCSYSCAGKAYEGDEAEDAVAALIGFGFALKGASKAANWGIPGLLWIQQGDGHQLADPVDHARDYLRTALELTVSAVASTAGDDLLARLKAERALLLTPETGKPRGAYLDALNKVAALDAEIAALDGQIGTYHADVDRLATLRVEQTKEATAKPWVAFRTRLEEARAALGASQQLQTRLKPLVEAEKNLTTSSRLLAEQLQGYAQLREAVNGRGEALARAQAARESAETSVAGWDAKLAEARRAVDAAAAVVAAATVEDGRAALLQQLDMANAERDRLSGVVEQAVAQAEALARHTADAAANTLAPDGVQRMDAILLALRELEIQQRAVATAIAFDLRVGVQVTLDGRAVDRLSEHRISAAASIEIAGVGRIGIVPGQSDAAELAAQVEAKKLELPKTLAALGAPTVEEVRLRQERHRIATAEASTAKQLLDLTAPKGVETVRTALAAAGSAADNAQKQLQALAPVPVAPLPSLAEAKTAHQFALQALQAFAEQQVAAAQALAGARASEQAAADECAKARTAIGEVQQSNREAETQGQLVLERAKLEETRAALGDLRQLIEQARPEELDLEVNRLQASLDASQTAHQQRAVQISNLEGALEQVGANGLEDRRADLEATRQAQRRRRDELRLRANGLQLLVQRMEDKRQALTRRLQAPLQARLDHYLRLVFPGGSMSLREDLTPGDLVRGTGANDTAAFSQLSYGAQEQMALISRLAYADLLKEAGKPTLIILDDALVHSDAQRLEHMQRILYDAAQRHQVLLFTCQRERWTGLGVAARELRSFVTSTSASTRATAKSIITSDDL
jgi:hypothetical protein